MHQKSIATVLVSSLAWEVAPAASIVVWDVIKVKVTEGGSVGWCNAQVWELIDNDVPTVHIVYHTDGLSETAVSAKN